MPICVEFSISASVEDKKYFFWLVKITKGSHSACAEVTWLVINKSVQTAQFFEGQHFCISLIFISILSELLFRNDAEWFPLTLIREFVIQEDYIFNPICMLASYYIACSAFSYLIFYVSCNSVRFAIKRGNWLISTPVYIEGCEIDAKDLICSHTFLCCALIYNEFANEEYKK
jgi:hypothetical protein